MDVLFWSVVASLAGVGITAALILWGSGAWRDIWRTVTHYPHTVDPCPWCQPPGSGKRIAYSRIYGNTETSCGDCAGAGKVTIRLPRFDSEERKRLLKAWEKPTYDEEDEDGRDG